MTRNPRLIPWPALVCALSSLTPVAAQESVAGFTMPMTVTAGFMDTHRRQLNDPGASTLSGAVEAMLYPSVRFDQHWFASAAIQLGSSPFYYFQAYSSNHEFSRRVIQGLMGYTRIRNKNSLTIKAGQLVSAFGSFPLRYDNEINPLIDAPLGYGASEYGPLTYPVTLYGLAGAEVDVNWRRLDARLQFVNSSLANPRILFAGGQTPNWVGGGGYTISQGFRIGASVAHGGYLTTGKLLLPTENASNWPVTAVGVDVQWARGYWAATGEWQRFHFPYPRIIPDINLTLGYAELKRTLHPRLYVAARVGYNTNMADLSTWQPFIKRILPDRQSYELAVGLRLNRLQLLKVGYEWLHKDRIQGTKDNVFGLQLITSLNMVSKAFLPNRDRQGAVP